MMEQRNTPLRFILNTAGRYKVHIWILTLVQALLGASGVLYAFFLRDIINNAVAGDTGAFWRSAAWIILLVVVQLVCRTLVRHLDELAKSNIENAFKKRLFGSVLVGNYGEFLRTHSAQWMNRLTSDTKIVTDALVQLVPSLAAVVVRLIAAFCAISVLEPRFLYLLIPGGILMVGISYIGRKKMKSLHKDVQKADDSLRSKLQDFLVGMAVVRSYSTEQFSLDSVSEHLNQHKKMRMRRNVFSNFCHLGFGVLMQGAYLLCAVFCGYGILNGTIDFGSFTALLQLTGQIQAPIASVSGYIPQYYTMIASAERLMEAEENLLRGAERGFIAPCDMNKVREFYGQKLTSIGLEHVSFSYPESEGDTLSDVSIEIAKGQTVALMGLSGCGKSTMLKLLMGLYAPQRGRRFVRTTDGGEGESAVIKNLFAYVPQGNDLMSGTIREIIAFADMSAMHDEERIRHALAVSCSDSFVDELEHGVDTELGEQGAGLSEGQMQRLAIARAVFSEHPILLLDECTSALDGATEERLLKNLKELTDKTTIIITHRPAALDICDTVCEVTKLQKQVP